MTPKGLAAKPKNRANSTKDFSEQFEGVTGSLPSKTRVLRRIASESSPERSAKSLSHSFFVVPFLSRRCETLVTGMCIPGRNYIYIYGIRPICRLHFGPKNPNFPSFIVKNGPEKMDSKTCQNCMFCCPLFFYVSHRKRQNVLFRLEKVGSKLV